MGELTERAAIDALLRALSAAEDYYREREDVNWDGTAPNREMKMRLAVRTLIDEIEWLYDI